ncbi:MAG: peptidoglycan-associated lipoprotein Pal [Acidobacteria bacterium]|nr:peptidoglycan-associated lipoprotein Pal [Acidobacteriota bacterium]
MTVTEPPPPPPPPPPPKPEPVTPRVEAAFADAVTTIHFAFDSSALDDDAQDRLRRAAEWLNRQENRTVRFRIEGNCDERGTDEYNLALGDRRANAARDFLVSLGVGADRIETVSYGEARPADPASNEEAWARNRRDDFVYLTGGPVGSPSS